MAAGERVAGGGGGVGLENTLQEIFTNNKIIIMNIDY